MKNLLLILIVSMICIKAYTQPLIEMGVTSNRAIHLGAGYRLKNGVSLSLTYNTPFFKAFEPKRACFIMAGELPFTDEENYFFIMPYVGINYYRTQREDHQSKYLTGLLPVYGLKFGRNWHSGNLFISATASNGLYFGAGITAYIKK